MNILGYFGILFFLIGTALGSFSGVLMEDGVKKRSFWNGRSKCTSCKKTLEWYELIPIFSYLIQHGKCRHCGKRIPSWVFHIEWMMGVVWIFFGTLFVWHGFSVFSICFHLLIITMLLVITIYDARTMLIPDKFSIPTIIVGIIGAILFSYNLIGKGLPVVGMEAFWGAVCGMCFYLIQMIVPAFIYYGKKGRGGKMLSMLFTPILFPFWLVLKILLGEKNADKVIPSIALLDAAPTWVGGGDVRLGIIVGMLLGPMNLLFAISIGYTSGMLYYGWNKLFGAKKITMLPVAPLLFVGLCIIWAIKLF